MPRKPARAERGERVVHATVRRKDLAKQLSKEAIDEAGDIDDGALPIIVDERGDLLVGEDQAAAACHRGRGGEEIEVLMIVDAELAECLLDAKVDFDEVLDEVLDEAERSETETETEDE